MRNAALLCVSCFALASLAAPRPAAAQQYVVQQPAPEYPVFVQPASSPPPSRFFMHATLGFGVGGYWQLGGADRDALGLPIEVSFGLGGAVSEHVVLGGYVNASPWMVTSVHNRVSGTTYAPIAASPLAHLGMLLDLLPGGRNGLFAMEFTFGWGGGGGGTRWGGTGPFVSLAPALRFLHAGRSHLGVFTRFTYSQLFWTDNGAVRPTVMATIGLDWSWH